jgi:outer membrane protein TolC
MSFHGGSPMFRRLFLGLLGTSITTLAADPGATKSKSFAKPKVNPTTLIAAAPDASAAAADPTSPATPAPAIDPTNPPPIVPNPANPALPDASTVPPSTTTPLIPPIKASAIAEELKPRDKTLPPVPTKSDAAEKASEVEGTISTHRIGLLDAVRITLLKNPIIKLTAEDVTQARASLRVATGQFDTTLSGHLNWSYQQNELPPDQAKSQNDQFHKNQVQRGAIEKTIKITEGNIKLLEQDKDAIPDTSNITDAKQKADADLNNQIDQQIKDLGDQILRNVATPDQLAQFNKIKSEGHKLSANVEKDLLTGLKGQLKNLNKQIEQFPPIQVRKVETTDFELDLLKEFRNGILFGPFVSYNRQNDNFTRRSGIGDFGQSQVGLQIIVPLGKGSGDAASAQERSSAVQLEASRLNLQHTISQTVLQTVQAYWAVVAAQERLRLLFRSELISGALVDLSRELIKADEMAPSELAQIEAQLAIRTSQRIAAEQDLVGAAQNLALSMGLDLNEILTAPLADEHFPEALPADQLKAAPRFALASLAMENRADRLASLKAQLSSKILVDAARINLKPNVGLQVRTSYAGNTQDSQYEAYWRAFDREVGPSVSAALSLNWPLENNAARGQFEQSSSFYNQSLIQTDQLSRSIISSVVVDLSALQRGRDQIDKAQLSANDFEKALETEREKLKLGNSTLINVIETEQNLTNALLQVISARQQYAVAVAQLRFDTGTLMPHASRSVFSREDFVTLPPVTAIAVHAPVPVPTPVPVVAKGKPAKKK